MEITPSSAISTAVEGLKKAQTQIEDTAQNIAEGSLDPQDIVSLSLASTSFKANAAVIRTDNENTQALLDITA
jgi:flagellar hook protein FlgE